MPPLLAFDNLLVWSWMLRNNRRITKTRVTVKILEINTLCCSACLMLLGRCLKSWFSLVCPSFCIGTESAFVAIFMASLLNVWLFSNNYSTGIFLVQTLLCLLPVDAAAAVMNSHFSADYCLAAGQKTEIDVCSLTETWQWRYSCCFRTYSLHIGCDWCFRVLLINCQLPRRQPSGSSEWPLLSAS